MYRAANQFTQSITHLLAPTLQAHLCVYSVPYRTKVHSTPSLQGLSSLPCKDCLHFHPRQDYQVVKQPAIMTSSSVMYALCIVLCICSFQTVVQAAKTEKIQLTVYTHEIRGGPNATLLPAAGTGQGNISALGWGSFIVFDNFLKQGASPDSTLLGSFTGSSVVTTIGGPATGGVQVVAKFWFSSPESKYTGSSITVIGTLLYPLPPWEVIVVGGTGYFRGYAGYGLSSPEVSTTVDPLFVFQWKLFLYKQW